MNAKQLDTLRWIAQGWVPSRQVVYGHPVGDRVLHAVAQRLMSAVRDGDSLARWGGEEFLIVVPDTDTPGACA